jgi:hypothetical protein
MDTTREGFMTSNLEQIWESILSESTARVCRQLGELAILEQQAVLEHLTAMATEPGWSDGQRRRAAFALAAWNDVGGTGVADAALE